MNVTVQELPAMHVAYVRHRGPHGPGIRQAWEKLCRWAGPRGYLANQPLMIGVAHDNPSTTPPEHIRYDACVVVPVDAKPEGNIEFTDIPGGKHAVYRFEGSEDGIQDAYNKLYREWLPSSGYRPTETPAYEIYRNNPDIEGKFVFDLCLPVRPL